MHIRKYDEANITALVDTREQKPLSLEPFKMKNASLPTGDYTIEGLEKFICIERKSLEDFVMCVGRDRDRFEKEIQRMKAYETRAIVIECTWKDLELEGWRGRMKSSQVIGSLCGWVASGIPILTPGKNIAPVVKRIMSIAAKRKYLECVKLMAGETAEKSIRKDMVELNGHLN